MKAACKIVDIGGERKGEKTGYMKMKARIPVAATDVAPSAAEGMDFPVRRV